jgi:hypothetical protein
MSLENKPQIYNFRLGDARYAASSQLRRDHCALALRRAKVGKIPCWRKNQCVFSVLLAPSYSFRQRLCLGRGGFPFDVT